MAAPSKLLHLALYDFEVDELIRLLDAAAADGSNRATLLKRRIVLKRDVALQRHAEQNRIG